EPASTADLNEAGESAFHVGLVVALLGFMIWGAGEVSAGNIDPESVKALRVTGATVLGAGMLWGLTAKSKWLLADGGLPMLVMGLAALPVFWLAGSTPGAIAAGAVAVAGAVLVRK